ncbi:hypothetical protein ACOTYN_26360, partial [Enterobacter cloacae complex sp. IR5458]|uniref:hypothetical protein n=1 Tax=Enterobacter cloacae complex sp. IR5458 TaxID=3412375 RepID=UPI003B9D2E0C
STDSFFLTFIRDVSDLKRKLFSVMKGIVNFYGYKVGIYRRQEYSIGHSTAPSSHKNGQKQHH